MNIKLAGKEWAKKNTLAYFAATSVTKKRSFITFSPDVRILQEGV
jgi:hypothetical protein